jgi:GrpB-like predicted nucleotidyltransferase (UPF0157 family)
MRRIEVQEYDSRWPKRFELLRQRFWEAVGDIATSIEHVGSTSVPGLAAKPIIDIDIVVPTEADLPAAIEKLAVLGYQHIGELGVEGREAFRNPPDPIAHHLYLCPAESLGLRNHLAIRDFLRSHPDVAREYGALKRALANQYAEDLDSYIEGKSEFLCSILQRAGIASGELAKILESNRKI